MGEFDHRGSTSCESSCLLLALLRLVLLHQPNMTPELLVLFLWQEKAPLNLSLALRNRNRERESVLYEE